MTIVPPKCEVFHVHASLFHWCCLDDGPSSRGTGGTPLMLIISQRAACLRKEEPGRRVRSSKNELRAVGGCEGAVRSGVWTETEHCVCKEKCSLADTYGVFCRTSVLLILECPDQTDLRHRLRMISHHLNVKQSNQTVSVSRPSAHPSLCVFCCRRMYMSWGDSAWAGEGKQCSVTSRRCYFVVRGNS